jgi:quinolinate synthase
LKIVKALPNQNIFFIPDENLGRYIASKVPDKNFIFNEGFCHVHTNITKESVNKVKVIKQNMEVLAHPECKMEVLEIADFIGSTSDIIKYASMTDAKELLICTELGVLYELKKQNPNKRFYSVGHRQLCPNMKKITLEKIANCLINMETEVILPEESRIKAFEPLNKMLELAAYE